MSGTHADRIAVVTGAAKGIGQAIATSLADRGAHLILVDLDDMRETEGQVAAKGAQYLSVTGDVGEEPLWAEVARAARQRFGRVDILVNNAGIYPAAPLDELSYDLWRRVLRVNLDSQFLGAKAIVPLMAERAWGRIVNLSSNSIGSNIPGLSHYMASKMGVIGLTRGLANDLGGRGITVNAVCPSITRTPGTSAMPEEVLAQVSALQSIKKLADPSDIVGPIMFLTSNDAQFVTGQSIVVDGGMMKI